MLRRVNSTTPKEYCGNEPFTQQLPDRPKSQLFELQKGIAMIKSMAIHFRNHAHRLAASSWPSMPARRASPTSLRTAESRTFIVEGESDSILHTRPPLHQQRPGERPAGTEGEEVVERFPVVGVWHRGYA